MDGPGFPQAFQQAAATTQANKVNTCARKWASTWLADVLLSRGFREAFAKLSRDFVPKITILEIQYVALNEESKFSNPRLTLRINLTPWKFEITLVSAA